jgi:hypothetical protein
VSIFIGCVCVRESGVLGFREEGRRGEDEMSDADGIGDGQS